ASAAGHIWFRFVDAQQTFIQDVKTDPKRMWVILAARGQQKMAGPRFNAMTALFQVRLTDDEPLTATLSHV
ncbi:hypothetical protein K439DRAFT_1290474, partial [Ramaria rubella]